MSVKLGDPGRPISPQAWRRDDNTYEADVRKTNIINNSQSDTRYSHPSSGNIGPEACMCFNYVCIIIDNASFAFLLKCFILFYICVCVCVCVWTYIYVCVCAMHMFDELIHPTHHIPGVSSSSSLPLANTGTSYSCMCLRAGIGAGAGAGAEG